LRRRFLSIGVLALCAAVGLPACGDAPSSGAAKRAEKKAADAAADAKARQEADAAREAQRLLDLWTYVRVPVGKGHQTSASIYSSNSVDADGTGAKAVQLIFRDHVDWGKSSYLVLQGGDFNCYGGCTVSVKIDEAPPKKMAARRPPTDEAIAMFINDWRALWNLLDGAKKLTIEFPVKALRQGSGQGGTRTASYDVAGRDRSKMPWN
jgi:hypothetical protein